MTVNARFYKVGMVIFFMNIKMLSCLVLVFFGLFSGVEASASSIDIVNFTVNYNEGFENNTFEGFVSGLEVDDKGEDFVIWVWDNSEDVNFSHNLVFLDGALVLNGTEEVFEAEDLEDDKCYEISVISIGIDGVEGPRVFDVSCTLEEEDEDDDNDDDNDGRHEVRVRVLRDTSLHSFVDESVVDKSINLGSSVEKKDCDYLVLLCWILGLLIFVLLALIFVFSRR